MWELPLPKEKTLTERLILRLTKCRACGHVYQCPQQDKTYSDRYYDHSYGDGGANCAYWDPQLKVQHARDLIARLPTPTAGMRLLEVGAGMGAFASEAAGKGWTVVGTEMSQMAVSRAKRLFGVSLHLGPVETLPQQDLFDVAVLWDVIEHCPRPDSVLAAVSDRLRAGATVLLTTANYDSLDRLYAGPGWWCWEADHYHYFRPNGLQRLAQRAELGHFVIDKVSRIKAPESNRREPARERKKPLRYLNPAHAARAVRWNISKVSARYRWPAYHDIGVMLCAMTKT
jgi:2-polyprenyl-3-methyl-5-hydroxy-6-metoxy-1,4-benzoquinol methylase